MGRRLLAGVILALVASTASAPVRAQTGSVEDDAQEYTRLVMKHDRLALKNNMDRKMSQAELDEIAALRKQFEAFKAAYGPRGAMRAQGVAFEKRVKELSAELVQPAVQRWVAEEFPEPKQVCVAYTDPLQCSAAMQVLHGELNKRVGKPPHPDVAAKLRRYETAWVKLNPRSKAEYTDNMITIEKSMWNKKFQFQVLSAFVPLYAGDAGNAAREIEYNTDLETAKARVRSACLFLALAILALPLLYLMLGQTVSRQVLPRNPDPAYPFQLPTPLATVKVFRKRIAVEFIGGKIADKASWTETTTWTTTTPGQVRESGPWTFKDPDTSHTSSRTIHYYKYTVETPDGYSRTMTFVTSPADVETGQLFSMVVHGDRVLLYCNHTKDDHAWEGAGLMEVLAMPPGFLFWLASMAVATAGSMAINRTLVTGVLEGVSSYENVVGMSVFFTAVLSAIYIAVLRAKIRSIRARKFANVWLPRYRSFMDDITPALKRHFGGDERARQRLERRLEQQRSKNRSED